MTEAKEASSKRGRRGPYAKSDAVRDRILDACLELFAQSGFYGTTMKDVAAAAKISQTGLMHHFPTKTELLDAVLRRHYDHTATILGEVPRRDTLTAQARVLRDNAARPGIIQLHTIISAEASSDEHPAHAFFTKRLDDFREYLTGVFDDARADGRLRASIDSTQLASLYIAVQDGLQLQWVFNPEVNIEEGVQAFLSMVVDADVV